MTNAAVLERIATHIDLSGKNIIEVGPGYGALTEYLIASQPNSMTLVEYDPNMVRILEDRRLRGELSYEREFRIFSQDVLEFIPDRESVLVANIPYYITSPILTRFLYEVAIRPTDMIILMQKEVADKIVKKKGYGNSYLSLTLEYACVSIEKLFEVKAGDFVPPPKVDSAVVHFRVGTLPSETVTKPFIRLLSHAFAHPRKKVVSNLADANLASKEQLIHAFEALGLRSDARAEMLDLSQWKQIATALNILPEGGVEA